MASITIRNLDAELQQRLQHRAAQHGRSPEDEVCDILRAVLGPEPPAPENLATAIRKRFAPLGGVELDLPPREPALEQETAPATGLGTAIHKRFKALGGVELELPPREPMRVPSDQEQH